MGIEISFEGKVALVTGAAGGMGKAIATLLTQAGARVIAADISPAVAGLSSEIGAGTIAVTLDVSREADWEAAVKRAEEEAGPISVLVNCAGLFIPNRFQDTSEQEFERSIQVNQRGVFYGMRAVTPSMRRAGGGSIVNIVTGGALKGIPGMFGYCAAKWAARGMTRCAALDLAVDNIRVNAIHPGAIDTDMIKANGSELNAAIITTIPLKRMGTAIEIANAVIFLASDLSSYVTGADLLVDGGLLS